MKVKTNFKKMFLVDNLPSNNKTQNVYNDNAILNKYIETKLIDNEEMRNKTLDNVDKNKDKINNQIKNEGSFKRIISDLNDEKQDENKNENNVEIENENDVEIENKYDEEIENENDEEIENTNNDSYLIKDEAIENFKNTNDDTNQINDSSLIENHNSPSHKNTTNDFNLGKCLDDCFKKSSIKYDKNKKFDDIDREKLSVINDDENVEVLKERNDDDDDDDEKELLNRLERIRSNKKILKSKRRKRLERIRNIKRNLRNSILSKYKHKKYLPKQSLKSYMNNNVISKEGRNLKRKSSPDEESFYENKRQKIDLNIRAIPLINNESIESDSDMNLDYSDKSENDLESSMEDDDQIEVEDIIENEKPYSLRQNRKKPHKYQDYIMNDYVCRICDREFKNETALENHIKTCKIYSFACTICGKNYKTKWGLQSHLSNMHSRKKNRN